MFNSKFVRSFVMASAGVILLALFFIGPRSASADLFGLGPPPEQTDLLFEGRLFDKATVPPKSSQFVLSVGPHWSVVVDKRTLDSVGINNDIRVTARHITNPHDPPETNAGVLTADLLNVLPGQNGGVKNKIRVHPGGLGHDDFLGIRYDRHTDNVSKISIRLSHPTIPPATPVPAKGFLEGLSIGGVVDLTVNDGGEATSESLAESGWPNLSMGSALAALLAVVVLAAGGGWYARRRWMR